jgi:hypothetical protein
MSAKERRKCNVSGAVYGGDQMAVEAGVLTKL